MGGTVLSRRLAAVARDEVGFSEGDLRERLGGLDGRGDEVRGGGVPTRWVARSVGRGGVGRG